jgi:hypothetical protein
VIEEIFARFVGDLGDRVGGPLTFRLILQPAVAIFFAIRAGMRDAREGKPAYFWTLLTNPADRRRRVREGWQAVAKVFVLAVIIDVVYQVIVLKWVYPIEALVVAFLLACVPYLLLRGPANRIACMWISPSSPAKAHRP